MENFRTAVEVIFTHWTALQIAIEESGAHGAVATVTEVIDQIVAAAKRVVDGDSDHFERIEMVEFLVDLFDREFDTVCEDESPDEIALLLGKMITCVIKGGDPLQLKELQCLRRSKNWSPTDKVFYTEVKLKNLAIGSSDELSTDQDSAGPSKPGDKDDSGEIADVDDTDDSAGVLHAENDIGEPRPSGSGILRGHRVVRDKPGRKKKTHHRYVPPTNDDDESDTTTKDDEDKTDSDSVGGDWENVEPRRRK